MVWECVEECEAECCGIVPLPKPLAKKYEHLAQRKIEELIPLSEDEIIPVTKDLKCVFLNKEHECVIYDDRPELCQNYGIVPELQCPYLKENGNRRSPAKVKRARRLIAKEVDSRIKRIISARSGK